MAKQETHQLIDWLDFLVVFGGRGFLWCVHLHGSVFFLLHSHFGAALLLGWFWGRRGRESGVELREKRVKQKEGKERTERERKGEKRKRRVKHKEGKEGKEGKEREERKRKGRKKKKGKMKAKQQQTAFNGIRTSDTSTCDERCARLAQWSWRVIHGVRSRKIVG